MKDLFDRRPILVALAGPNGAGKSTFFRTQIELSALRFVNADELALLLNIDAYRAAEVAGKIRRELLDRGESFVFETVFSDPAGDKLAFLKEAERRGYTVVLIFIGVDSSETSEARVTMRVLKGGHDVPSEKIASRYSRVMKNLQSALRELNHVLVYDNSDLSHPYRLVVRLESGTLKLSSPTPDWLNPLLPLS